jgi:ubiquinone/menaquinone biosynthesis C-methylase UbiE
MILNYNSFIKWKIEKKIFKSEDYKLNNRIAEKISKKNLKIIVKRYTHITPENIYFFFKINRIIWNSFEGIGIDLGGGVGLVSSVIARKKKVKKIYCVEIVRNAVVKCQPIVKKKILKIAKEKVISVLGSFDNIELPNSSVDFCVAWDAMHHSNNLIKTLKEAKRVLKKNGKFIIVDRAHNNSTTDEEINKMLNVTYSKDFLKSNHLQINKVLTRRMNGEKEYRFKDWENFFTRSGFKIVESILIKEKHKKVLNTKNDEVIKEKIVNFELGGFERKKIIYLLAKIC